MDMAGEWQIHTEIELKQNFVISLHCSAVHKHVSVKSLRAKNVVQKRKK